VKRGKSGVNGLLTVFLLIVMLFGCSFVFAGDSAMDLVPADCLFYAQLNGLNKTLGEVDKFAAGVSPIPLSATMLVRGKLAQLLGNPALDGLDTAGTFAVYAKVPGRAIDDPTEIFTVILPISDYAAFLSSSNVGEPDAKGVSVLESVGGFIAKVNDSYAMLTPPGSYVRFIGQKELVGTGESLGSSLDASLKSQASSTPVWAYGNIAQVNATFGEQLKEGLQKMREEMAYEMANSPEEMPFDVLGMMGSYFDLIEQFLAEADYVTVGLTPKADVVKVSTMFSAKAGTEMAELLDVEGEPAGNKYINYIPNGSCLSMSGHFPAELNNKAMSWLFDLLGSTSPESEQWIKEYCDNYAKVMGGNFMSSFYGVPGKTPPFRADYIYELKEKGSFLKVMKGNEELFTKTSLGEMYEKMGLKMDFAVEENVDKYQGIDISSLKLSFDFPEVDSSADDDMQAQIQAMQAQMISKMYGDGLNYYLAELDGYGLMTISSDITDLHKLVDQVKAGPGTISSEMASASDVIGGADNYDMIMTLNAVRLYNMVAGMLPTPVPLQPLQIDSKSNIVMAGKIDDGKVQFDMAVPKAHVTEVMQGVQVIMMQSMMMQQQIQQEMQEAEAVDD